MENLFKELINGILESDIEKGYERYGENGLKQYQRRGEYEIPRFESFKLQSKFAMVETFNHGPGISITLEIEVSDTGSETRASGVNSVALGVVDPKGETSCLTSGALGWIPWELTSGQIKNSKESPVRKILSGQIPLSFINTKYEAGFQINIQSLVGNTNVQYFCLCLGEDENFNKFLEKKTIAKKKGDPKLKKQDDGDDPRDIPPPIIHGEEIDSDLTIPPVYSVSDFHIGSNRHGKINSQDMDYKTLERFIQWLKAVDADARDYDHYDVVMNGDFLDLWQAKRPKNDTYGNRLQDIIASNTGFFDALGKFLRGNQRCRFYYLIGNHDDPLSSEINDTSKDDLFAPNETHGSLRQTLKRELRTRYERRIVGSLGRVRVGTLTTALLPFSMQKQYSNSQYKLLMHHGHHDVDDVNERDSDGEQSGGQDISDKINSMQENYGVFKDIEFTPNNETVKYLNCLRKDPTSGKEIKEQIEELKDIFIDSSSPFWGNIGDLIFTDNVMGRTALERSSSATMRKASSDGAKEIINDTDRSPRVKIVSFGHTHLEDIDPAGGESPFAATNTGSWLKNIRFSGRNGCKLEVLPSNFPYVKISKEKGANKALVELKFFQGTDEHKLVKVALS